MGPVRPDGGSVTKVICCSLERCEKCVRWERIQQ